MNVIWLCIKFIYLFLEGPLWPLGGREDSYIYNICLEM